MVVLSAGTTGIILEKHCFKEKGTVVVNVECSKLYQRSSLL